MSSKHKSSKRTSILKLTNQSSGGTEESNLWIAKESKRRAPGSVYYYNTKTRECRWTPPPGLNGKRIESNNGRFSGPATQKTTPLHSRRNSSTESTVSSSNLSKRKRSVSDSDDGVRDGDGAEFTRSKKKRNQSNDVDFASSPNSSSPMSMTCSPVKTIDAKNFSFKILPAVENSGALRQAPSAFLMDASFSPLEDHATSSSAAPYQDNVEFMEVDEVVKGVNCFRKDVDANPLVPPPSIRNIGGDWDLALAAIETRHDVVFIVDTNLLLGDLTFVRGLVNDPARGIIVVPYVVIRELDCLKEDRNSCIGTRRTALSKSARTAIAWIYEQLTKGDRHNVYFQPSHADQSAIPYLEVSCSDDRVLKCAVDIAQRRKAVDQRTLSILCTNDKNLLNKGRINGLRCASKEELEMLFQSLDSDTYSRDISSYSVASDSYSEDIFSSSAAASSFPVPSSLPQLEPKLRTPLSGSIPTSPVPDKVPAELDDIVSSCKTILSTIAETEMQHGLGDAWVHIVKIKPPWSTLGDVLEVYAHHWIAIFQWVFANPKEAKEIVKELQVNAKNVALFGSEVLSSRLLTSLLRLLKRIRRHKPYGVSVDSLVHSMARVLSSRANGHKAGLGNPTL